MKDNLYGLDIILLCSERHWHATLIYYKVYSLLFGIFCITAENACALGCINLFNLGFPPFLYFEFFSSKSWGFIVLKIASVRPFSFFVSLHMHCICLKNTYCIFFWQPQKDHWITGLNNRTNCCFSTDESLRCKYTFVCNSRQCTYICTEGKLLAKSLDVLATVSSCWFPYTNAQLNHVYHHRAAKTEEMMGLYSQW